MKGLNRILAALATFGAGEAAAQEPPAPAQEERRAPGHMLIPRGVTPQPPAERLESRFGEPLPLDVPAPEIPIGEPRERGYLGPEDVGLTQRIGNINVGIVETSGASDEDAVLGVRVGRDD